jgi:SWI/SNF-related matrix-associated actin-dependent regulator 1 of chromatin subfamily A
VAVNLDFIEATACFTLDGVPDVEEIMRTYGLDYSSSAGLLYTKVPYAAIPWFSKATPAARSKLQRIYDAIEASWAPTSQRHFDVPEGRELWPFQGGSVAYALDRSPASIGFCDEPGLGKTEEAIVYANTVRAERVLVVCPAQIRDQWATRIREWSILKPWPTISVISSSRRGVPPSHLINWTIISYDLVRVPEIHQALLKNRYDILILDEAHYAKTTGAKRSQAIFGSLSDRTVAGVAERCQTVLALTGTPLPNRPAEAYTIARGLCWDSIDWMSQRAFQNRFNFRETREVNGKVFVEEVTGREPELQARLRSHFMTRHLKEQVMHDLNLPVYDLVHALETGPVKQALAAERLLDIDPSTFSGINADILGAIATARRLMGVALAPQVVDYVRMLLSGGETKIVLFAWHTEVLDILCSGLKCHGTVRIDGSTPPSNRAANVRRFIEDPSVVCIVGNILSLGTGTDGLQLVSNHAVIAEPDWVPGNNVQCFDRLNRGGQKRTVHGEIFVAPGSLAERILATALGKMNVIHSTLDRKDW